MKKSLLALLSLLICSFVVAQSSTVRLKIVDGKSADLMPGAVISLADSSQKMHYQAAGVDGCAIFKALNYGRYALMVTFVGYDTVRQNVVVDRPLVDVGDVKMREFTRQIDRVTIQANAIRTSQSGDTVIYSADAYRVTEDAVAEGLLAKMPGITVKDGEVEAHGEKVKRVYLDGKEFFGEDVTVAVKNIPADIISKVEVFNKLSDEAEFTGFDDGNSYKALNIVTKTGTSHGQFGKFTAGYNTGNLYQLNASYSYFKGDQRISLVGSTNNMNIRGFGGIDISSYMNRGRGRMGGGSFMSSPSGLTTSTGLGLNYGGSFLDDKMKVTASYYYNTSDSENTKQTDRIYITDTDLQQRYYDAASKSASDNFNHRFDGSLEYKPNARHSFMMRPSVAFQGNGSANMSMQNNRQTDDQGLTFTELNSIDSDVTNDKDAYTISNYLVYRALLGRGGRNITLSANGNYTNSDNISLSSVLTDYPDMAENLVKQQILNDSKSYNLNSNITYSEPIMNKSGMLTLKYNIRHNYSDADYLVYEWEQQQNIFNPDYDPTSSNIYNSGYTTHNIGPGFMYSKPRSLTLNANVSYQYASLANEQDVPVTTPAKKRYTFDDFVYNLMMNKSFNRTNNLRISINSNTQNPSISSLQDVVKDSNPQYVTTGNSQLKPSYSHSMRATYIRSNVTKGRTFVAMLSGSLTDNYIGDSTVMLLRPSDSFLLPNGNQLDAFGQFSKPINLDGSWNVASSVNFGTPVYALYSNVNFDFGARYSESPSIFNGIKNLSRTTNLNAVVSVGSNISEKADFTISYSGGYNIANYKYNVDGKSSQNNEYLTQGASLYFKFVLWAGITLSGTTSYSQYKGITDKFNQEYVFCNVYIGKKLFKNRRGEISIGANDIFNHTENFTRNVTDTYVENVLTNSIGRYFGVKFTFDLRSFSGSANGRGGGYGGGYGGYRGSYGGGRGGYGGGFGGRSGR